MKKFDKLVNETMDKYQFFDPYEGKISEPSEEKDRNLEKAYPHVGKTYKVLKDLIFDGNFWYPPEEEKTLNELSNEDIPRGSTLFIKKVLPTNEDISDFYVLLNDIREDEQQAFDIHIDNLFKLVDNNVLEEV